MSNQLRYLQNYEKMVEAMLAAYPEDRAMELAVGGNFEHFGVLEHALLRQIGMGPNSHVVDVGCGSGRLAVQLSRYEGLRYAGFDIVRALVDYARRKAGRPDFQYGVLDRHRLPLANDTADIVAFFSVFTHMLHEESFAYLLEAKRVLRPGGTAVFSFLEFCLAGHWEIFKSNVDWVCQQTEAGHLNVFINRADLAIWAEKLGMELVAIHPGHERFIRVDGNTATAKVPAGDYALGQSVCILKKPAGAGEQEAIRTA